MPTKVTPEEIIDLVRRLPDADLHIHSEKGSPSITNEWLVGAFAGRGFTAPTLVEAAQEMINYLYKHISHRSMVGREVTDSGFPDLKKVERYLTQTTHD